MSFLAKFGIYPLPLLGTSNNPRGSSIVLVTASPNGLVPEANDGLWFILIDDFGRTEASRAIALFSGVYPPATDLPKSL